MEPGFTLPDSRGVPAPLWPCTPRDAFGGGWCVDGRAKGGEPGAMLWHRHTCITPGRAKPVQSHVAFALHAAIVLHVPPYTGVQALGALLPHPHGHRICTPEHKGANQSREGAGGCKFGATAELRAKRCPANAPTGLVNVGEAARERSLP